MSYYNSTITSGIALTGTPQNPVTVAASGDVTNTTPQYSGDAVYGTNIAAWNLTNFGNITATGAVSSAVDFRAGGTVTNAAGALIAGVANGVYISGGVATITNSGTLSGSGVNGYGVYLGAGGSVTNGAGNATAALISGGYDGVAIGGIATVGNFGTISGGSHDGINLLGGGTVINGASGATTALIEGTNTAIAVGGGGAGTVVNFGTILASGTIGYVNGIYLIAGTVVNGATDLTSALVSSVRYGVQVAGAAGAMTNYGTIVGTGVTYGTGVYLRGGGSVGNAQNALISGMHVGAAIKGSLAGTVSNLGTIAAIGTVGYVDGVYLGGPGTVVNGAPGVTTALISSVKYGVVMYGTAAGVVSNFGTINGGGSGTVAIAGSGVGVYFKGVGAVVNGAAGATSAVISGVNYAVKMAGTAVGAVTNFGTIVSTILEDAANQIFPDGIFIAGAGTIRNGATDATSALISSDHFGIYIAGTATSSVDNFGTIQGTNTNGAGIYLNAAGIVSNVQTGLIAGADDGVVMQGIAPSTVSNLGTITGGNGSTGIGGSSFGLYIKGSGTVVNGASDVTSALIRGADCGIGMQQPQGPAIVTNFGTIVGGNGTTGQGAYVGNLGSVINGAPNAANALISGGSFGVRVAGLTGTVINYGIISATATSGTGIYLSLGTVANFGAVTAGASGTGIYLLAGNVTNSGTIVAPGASAVIVRYGTFFNYGVVEGAVSGIELSLGTGIAGTGEVKVSGTVSGTTGISVAPSSTADQTVTVAGSVVSTLGTVGKAVALGSGSDRLIVDPGAAFTGTVDGGGGTNVLEIAGLSGASSSGGGLVAAPSAAAYVSLGSVTNFSALEIDPSATFGGVGVLSFATLVNQGQINVGAGNSLALGVVVSAANAGVIDLQSGGTITFHGSVGNQTLLFQPPGGTALIDHPEAFLGTLSGFTTALDIVDLTTLNPVGASATLDAVSDRLVVTSGTQSVSLQLATGVDYTGITWQTSSDGGTGTDVAPVCFCRGTLIQTDRGEVPVEALAVGDRVVTLSGAARPIRWIGFGRDLVTRRHSLARPIVVRRGALADDVPRRDLHLTHGHALYLGGVLVPVENLVNHRTILWDEAARVVEYYHIELDDHDVLFAEGAPAESYYDAANRALFHNTRPGSEPGAGTPTYAPVETGGAAVERVWAQLYARAGGQITREATDDPDLHLVIDGARRDPVSGDDGVYIFALAAPPTGPLRLCSRSAVPSLAGTNRHDHRRLGVALRRIILCGPGLMTALDHDAPLFAQGGCHPPEPGHSWTDGELTLPAALFTHLTGAFTLLVHTSKQAIRYPVAGAVAA